MGFKDLFSTDTDSALPPENRLDEAIRELGKYYVAEGKNRISTAPADSETEEKSIESTEDLALLQKIRSMILDTSSGAKHAVEFIVAPNYNVGATMNSIVGDSNPDEGFGSKAKYTRAATKGAQSTEDID